jgi:hypothetical protein
MFDHGTGGVPTGLDSVPPGYVLAAILDDIDLGSCSGYDRIRVLQAYERMRSHYAARRFHAMASVVAAFRDDPDEADFAEEAAAAEVAAALRLTRRAADVELSLALELQRRLPTVWRALGDGVIDVRRARLLVDATSHHPVATAREIVAGVLSDAPLLTTGQLGAKLRKLCIEVNPQEAADRYRHAVEDRRVVTEAAADGTASLYAVNLPPDRVAAAKQRINRLALGKRSQGDQRSMDQLRADILLDLVEGTGAAAGRGMVDIQVDVATLARLVDHPGDLAGYGPVIADIARQVAHHQHDAEWRWTLVDPDTGVPIDGGTTRRRPTTAQRRRVQTRNRTCVHPGCRMPAVDCDLDHCIPWAERQLTSVHNLAPLCRHHHVIRHKAGWSYRPLRNGDYQFTTPLGHTYTTSGRSP